MASLILSLVLLVNPCIPGSECRDDADCGFECWCSTEGYCESS